ncbi:MAG: hypothetical protein RJA49_1158, partial [Actinomycetota bacterium]
MANDLSTVCSLVDSDDSSHGGWAPGDAASLERINRALAHDLRNIFSVINLCAVDLYHEMKGRQALTLVMEVLHAAERGLAASTELLHAGRGEAPAPRPVDLRRHILALQPLLGRVAGSGVDTVVTFGDEPLFVRVDRTSAMQVLMNLVSNAAEAMRSSGCIRISASADGGDAVLVVTDDGPGIPASLREKVFDDGYTTKSGAHWGLGLAVVRRVVGRCGGTITLDDALPVGTEIRIRFPLVEPERSGLALVVAGDDITRQLLGAALERAGFSVVAA